jgi:choice-of-anchor C domain-containing protein
MKNLFILGAVTLILIGASVRPTTSQIVNGSFETGSGNPGSTWITLTGGSTLIDGWLVSSGTIDYIGGWWQASDGGRSLDMNGGNAGEVSQMVPTVPGQTYSVTFDMSGNADCLPTVKLMTVSVDGGQPQTFSYDIVLNGNSRLDMRWETNVYTFTATAATTLLAFTSNVTGFCGPTLDNVAIAAEVEFEQICHRNFGKKEKKTLLVDPSSIPDHLAHGDTLGPCVDE